MTPLTCWNTACTPQKHPPANTADCWLGADARGESKAGAGIVADGLAFAVQAVVARSDPNRARAKRADDDIVFPFLDSMLLIWWIGVMGGKKVARGSAVTSAV